MMTVHLFTNTSMRASTHAAVRSHTLTSLPCQQQGDTTPTVLLIVLACIALLAIGYLVLHLFILPTPSAHIQEGPVFTSKPVTASIGASPTDALTDPKESTDTPVTATNTAATAATAATTATAATANTDNLNLPGFDSKSIPDPKAIINAKIPESESLAKEEIDRLQDEKQRLAAQEKSAKEQVKLIAEINQQKAAQIVLLEKQIAQLEAAQTGANP